MEYRTYENTVNVVRSWIEPVGAIVMLSVALTFDLPQFWTFVLIGAALILGLVFGGSAYLNWAAARWLELDQAARENKAITPATVAARIELEKEREMQKTLVELSRLSPDQLQYARERAAMPQVEIDGARVVWILDDERIPITFAADYWEKWQARGGAAILPAARDWDDDPHRDVCRSYERTIRRALLSQGYIRDASGPIPARWLVKAMPVRNQAMGDLGFWTALALADFLTRGNEDEFPE